MNVLPIRLISEIDQAIFGTNLLNLGRLNRLGFPVLPGIAISPPEIILQTALKHPNILQIPLPAKLEHELNLEKSYYFQDLLISKKNVLWRALLEVWLNQIREKILKEGFSKEISTSLDPQVVFFINSKSVLATAYHDHNLDEVMISCEEKLPPPILKEIDGMVLAANKKLFLPYIYSFLIIKGQVYLTGLCPFTQTLLLSKTTDVVIPQSEQRKVIRKAVRVFLNLSSDLTLSSNFDGVLIEGEGVLDPADLLSSFDRAVFHLAEAALSFPHQPVIFKLPDINKEGVRGTLGLIHQQKILSNACQVFLFVRHKKGLLNTELALPLTRSLDEFVQIKRELAVKGISRKGTLKLWLEIAIPENIINIEDYLEAGLDGVILNLDALQLCLGGCSPKALIKFITPLFKTLHKDNIPVLVKGELSINHDVLDILIENGVWGIVANTPVQAEGLPEQLNWLERRLLTKIVQ